MKIYLISTSALPSPCSSYGGIEQVVYDLGVGLARRGHDVTVACPTGSNFPPEVQQFYSTYLPNEFFKENIALMRILDDPKLGESDVIHDHSHAKLLAPILAPNEFECTYVNTAHCTEMDKLPLQSPCLTTLSNDHKEQIKSFSGMDSKVVYNGIDMDEYTFKATKSDRYIFLGRPSKIKGTLDAISLCKKLDVPLDVVGGNFTEDVDDYLVEVARACKLGSKQKYWGSVSHEVKRKLLSEAKALIFSPSRGWREPFGLIIPEALASGTPVVTWNTGVFKELIVHGKTGFLANNPEEFMDYMKQVDNINPYECRNYVARHFSSDIMCDKYLKLYEDVKKGVKW